MARGGADFRELEQFTQKLEQELQGEQLEEFIKGAVKFLTAQFLMYVIPKTPVDDKSKNHVGGTLRRGWTNKQDYGENPSVSAMQDFMNDVSVLRVGNKYILRVINPTEYASYVEYGHRTRNDGGMGYVQPQHFMTKTEEEIEAHASEMLEDLLREKLASFNS